MRKWLLWPLTHKGRASRYRVFQVLMESCRWQWHQHLSSDYCPSPAPIHIQTLWMFVHLQRLCKRSLQIVTCKLITPHHFYIPAFNVWELNDTPDLKTSRQSIGIFMFFNGHLANSMTQVCVLQMSMFQQSSGVPLLFNESQWRQSACLKLCSCRNLFFCQVLQNPCDEFLRF